MKSMVNDFANYARMPQMQAEPFALDALAAEVLELYRGGPVRIEARLTAADAQVRGDSKRLRQVLHNLLKNAIEALEERNDGHIAVDSRVVDSSDTRFVELSVEDNGGGIDADLIGRLFEPYVTSKAKGTGLGLAIVKKIIEEHGGIIWVENTTQGARFTARLPVWRADPRAPAPTLRHTGGP